MAAERDAIAVLLMAYGGPDSLDDVEPYLLDMRGGRPVSPEVVAEVKARYARVGRRPPPRPPLHTHGAARSLPERSLASADPYPSELRASAAAVAQRAGVNAWHFAYQSAGATAEPWLGPEAGALMTDVASKGQRAFLIVPIGFVSDHVEVLYDVDIVYRDLAGRLGVHLERTASLNDDPLLVAAIAEIAHDAAAGRGWL